MILCHIVQLNVCTLEKQVSIELNEIQHWLDVNKLSFNVSKTKYSII